MKCDNQKMLFLEHAIEHIQVGIRAIDIKGNVLIYNNKMKEIEDIDEIPQLEHSFLHIMHPNHPFQSLQTVIETEVPILRKKHTYWNKQGHEITTHHDTFPLYDDDKLIGAIEFARDITSLEKLVYQPLRRYGKPLTFDIITAVSNEMKDVIKLAKKAAYLETPLLLVGESGTGKDMIAEGIHHYLSPKRNQFITFFSRREDEALLTKVEQALKQVSPCTIFFERIEFLSIEEQRELLKLLENNKERKHMYIASTGNDPINLIAEGVLLKELYYTFAAFTITVPPLRLRKQDIEPFVDDYFMRHREHYRSNIIHLSTEVLELFMQYDWPGNLKELELLLDEVTSTITTEDTLTIEMLPLHFLFRTQMGVKESHKPFTPNTKQELLPLDDYLKQAEEFYIDNVLKMHDGNITKAAQAIQISRQNLQYRIRKLKKK